MSGTEATTEVDHRVLAKLRCCVVIPGARSITTRPTTCAALPRPLTRGCISTHRLPCSGAAPPSSCYLLCPTSIPKPPSTLRAASCYHAPHKDTPHMASERSSVQRQQQGPTASRRASRWAASSTQMGSNTGKHGLARGSRWKEVWKLSLSSQLATFSMSLGSGLPVVAYTVSSVTSGKAMWHDCSGGVGGGQLRCQYPTTMQRMEEVQDDSHATAHGCKTPRHVAGQHLSVTCTSVQSEATHPLYTLTTGMNPHSRHNSPRRHCHSCFAAAAWTGPLPPSIPVHCPANIL
jgi:hypothetical protein